MERKGFEVPNHTQTPNSFFDVSLPEIKSLVELKVVLAVIRQTFGWQKMSDKISLSQLQRLTGLSRESVSIGVQAALTHEFIDRTASGHGFTYSLRVVRNSDQSGIPTSRQIRPEVVMDSDQKVVGNSDPQKKEEKKDKENTAHATLFKHHKDRIGPIPDGAAQGAAIKWLLNAYSPQQAIDCYDSLATEVWRHGRVNWLIVKGEIGNWLASRRTNSGVTQKALTSADVQRMKESH